jgi:hypothetical protein
LVEVTKQAASTAQREAPRIGGGSLLIGLGLVLLLGGTLFAVMLWGEGAGAAGIVTVGLGVVALWLGFFMRMFHMIERRLMDIQTSLSR